MIANVLQSSYAKYAGLILIAVAFATLYAVCPALAQSAGVSADDLAGPVKTGAQSAVIAGFGIAVVMLVAIVIYRAVRRFLG